MFGCPKEKGGKMDFYTTVLKKSGQYWVALCLENGLVGQGTTKEGAIVKLKEAIDSFEEVKREEKEVYNAPISSPPYVLRILRQFGFADSEIENLLK